MFFITCIIKSPGYQIDWWLNDDIGEFFLTKTKNKSMIFQRVQYDLRWRFMGWIYVDFGIELALLKKWILTKSKYYD